MNDSGFVEHCLELLSPLGSTRANRMFGGYGLYIDNLCVALVSRDTLYLKVDEPNRAAFEGARCQIFVYETKNGETGSLSYFTAPEEAMESPHEIIPWARRALAAAVAARAKAAPKWKKLPAAPGKALKEATLAQDATNSPRQASVKTSAAK